jgi:hypothetical protein
VVKKVATAELVIPGQSLAIPTAAVEEEEVHPCRRVIHQAVLCVWLAKSAAIEVPRPVVHRVVPRAGAVKAATELFQVKMAV